MSNFKKLVKNHPVFISTIIYMYALFCQSFTLVKSHLLSEMKAEILVSAVLCYIFIVFTWYLFNSYASVYITTMASVLVMANWSQVMLHYSCNSDYTGAKESCIIFGIAIVACCAVAWGVFRFLNKFRNKRKTLTFGTFIVTLLFVGLIWMFSGTDATSTVYIHGFSFQPAIIMMFLMLFSFAGVICNTYNLIERSVFFICFVVMIGVLLLKHEFGIPLLCIAGCGITYMFLYPRPKKWFIIFSIVIIALILGFVLVKYPDLRTDTVTKFTSRIHNNEHTETALLRLKTTTETGTIKYEYLPQSSTDFALNTNVFYWGYNWLYTFMLIFSLGCYTLWWEYTRPGGGTKIILNMQKLSLVALFCVIGYNILCNVAGFPIVGVQALFTGKSISIACLSGLMLGAVTYSTTITHDASEKGNSLGKKLLGFFR